MQTTVEIGRNSQGNSPSLATLLSQMSWGGSNFPAYEGRCEDAGGAGDGGGAGDSASSAAAGDGSGTPASAAGSPPAGQTPASSSGAPTNGGAGAGNDNDANIRTLRQNYETLKPWEKVAQTLKDPAAALQAHERVQGMFKQGSEMAKALGYTEESFKAAFEDDPVDTLSHLRGEFNKANPDLAAQERMNKAAREAARKETAPITEQLNRQQTEVAMQKFDSEFTRLLTDDKLGFGKDVPDDVRKEMFDLMDAMITDDVLKELKSSGKVAGIQKVFEQAKGRLIKTINAYNGMIAGQARGNGGGNGNGNGGKPPLVRTGTHNAGGSKPLTLDDIIGNPEANLPGLKAGKY